MRPVCTVGWPRGGPLRTMETMENPRSKGIPKATLVGKPVDGPGRVFLPRLESARSPAFQAHGAQSCPQLVPSDFTGPQQSCPQIRQEPESSTIRDEIDLSGGRRTARCPELPLSSRRSSVELDQVSVDRGWGRWGKRHRSPMSRAFVLCTIAGENLGTLRVRWGRSFSAARVLHRKPPPVPRSSTVRPLVFPKGIHRLSAGLSAAGAIEDGSDCGPSGLRRRPALPPRLRRTTPRRRQGQR